MLGSKSNNNNDNMSYVVCNTMSALLDDLNDEGFVSEGAQTVLNGVKWVNQMWLESGDYIYWRMLDGSGRFSYSSSVEFRTDRGGRLIDNDLVVTEFAHCIDVCRVVRDEDGDENDDTERLLWLLGADAITSCISSVLADCNIPTFNRLLQSRDITVVRVNSPDQDASEVEITVNDADWGMALRFTATIVYDSELAAVEGSIFVTDGHFKANVG